MRLYAIVIESKQDRRLRLHWAWDDEQVASDPELIDRQIAEALCLADTERAGVTCFETDDLAVRACLVRQLPTAIGDGH